MVAFLPLSGKADVARHEDIVDTEVKVATRNMGTGQLGIFKELVLLSTQATAATGLGLGRHSATFIWELRGTKSGKKNRVFHANLPFKAKVGEAVDGFATTSNHVTRRESTKHTGGIRKVGVASEREGHDILVKLELNSRVGVQGPLTSD